MDWSAPDWLDLAQFARPMWIIWMMALFLVIACYAFRPRNKPHFDDCAQIPFRGESEVQPHD